MNNYSKIFLTLFTVSVLANISLAQRKYTITEIQIPASVLNVGLASINNQAEVVGSADIVRCVDDGGGNTSRTPLESSLKGENSGKHNASSLGVLCFSQRKPIYYSNQTGVRILSTPANPLAGYNYFGDAVEINDSGQIVGKAFYENINGNTIGLSYTRAAIWASYNAPSQWIATPAAISQESPFIGETPFVSINNSGQILSSQCVLYDSPYYCDSKRWFITGSGWITPTNVSVAYVSKITDRGEVIFKIYGSNFGNKIFLYGQTGFIHITPSLAANESWIDIDNPLLKNNGDVIISGLANTPTGQRRKKFLIKSPSDNPQITDISSQEDDNIDYNEVIPQNSGWVVSQVIDSNEKGQILVEGAKNGISNQYAILTPEPLRPLIFAPGTMGSSIRGDWNGRDVPYWVNLNPIATVDLPSVYNLTLDVTSDYYKPSLYASDVMQTGLSGVYKALTDSLKEKGYKPYDFSRHLLSIQGCDLSQKNNDPTLNPSLFVFPYDWRQDNSQSADKLREYIQCVQQFYPPDTKIDIVAHSQGGLLARRYVLQMKTRNEPHGLSKVITIASPFLGAPEATYKLYTGGDWDGLFSVFVLSPFTIKSLSPYFPSMHQLLPSRKYHELEGAIIAESGDVNGNGIPDEVYSFQQNVSQLNADFPATTPGTVGAGFHDFVGQDDWSTDQSDIQYSHIIGEQNQLNTTHGLSVEKSVQCRMFGTGIGTSGRCFQDRLYTPAKGYGDKTVPTISAMRIKRTATGVIDLNSPTKNWYIWQSPSANNADEELAEHNGIHKNPKTHALVAYLLGVGPRPTINPPDENRFVNSAKSGSQSNASDSPDEENNYTEYLADQYPAAPNLADYSPARYLTIIGRTEVIVRDETGNVASIQNGLLNNQVEGLSNYEVIGENSIMLTLAVGHSYTVEFPAGETPMAIEMVEGRGNRQPTAATRYKDLNIPANANVKFSVSQAGVIELKYDADGNGEFETIVPPTVSLSGTAASDTTLPTVNINVVQQGDTATATITAQDAQSGVSRIWYSFNGQDFQIYTAPVTLQYSANPITIYSFADDAAGNRSGLYSKTFTFTQTQPNLAVKPVLECVTANADGTFIAKFGYLNENNIPVTIAVGSNNRFTPLPQDRGQTTNYQPGRIRFAFSVPFDGNNLVWTLKSPNGSQRTSTASRNSARCQ